ncbi:MAG: NAD(+)/NADH kinase [Rheinheimera sp.]|nr:NAD(+)/NADH kinase [Rheinheimera sp.]
MAAKKGNRFRLGFIINPFAGLGGSVAPKGREDMAATALALGAVPMASQRAEHALQELLALRDQLIIVTAAGAMGADLAEETRLYAGSFLAMPAEPSTATDSEEAAAQLSQLGIDLLLFAGGDGTARNI